MKRPDRGTARNVLFVSTSYLRGSRDYYVRFVHEQARSLRLITPPLNVTVVAPHGPGLTRKSVIDDITIVRFKYAWPASLELLAYQNEGLFETLRNRRWRILLLPSLILSMLFTLLRLAPSASIIHAQWLPTAAVALIAGRIFRKPVVVSLRGADVNVSRGSAIGRFLTRFLVQRVDHVFTVSDEFRDYLLDTLGVTTPVTPVYNGVDTQEFRPLDQGEARKRLDLEQNAFIILYVGALIIRKDVITLIKAFARHAADHRRSQLYLVGEGPEADALHRTVQDLNLGDRVIFSGPAARQTMTYWMNACDVFVLPSFSEGRPNVVLEAMSCRRPIIATGIPGNEELLEHMEDALLFAAGDSNQLESHLNVLADDRKLGAGLAEHAYLSVSQEGLTWRHHGERLMSVYRELLCAES